MAELSISVSTGADGVVTCVVRGEVDHTTADTFRGTVAPLIARKPAGLVLDLTSVAFMDTDALGKLLALHREAARSAVPLTVLPGRSVAELLHRTGTDALLRVAGTGGVPQKVWS